MPTAEILDDGPVNGTIKIQPKWKNAPTRGDLHHDFLSAEDGQEDWKERLRRWEEIRDGGRVIKTKKGKSTARPLVVRKANEWKYPALEEPFLNTRDMFKVYPREANDIEAAEQNATILNYQWGTKIRKVTLVADIVRTVTDEGTVIVKTGWDSQTGIKEVPVEKPVYASPEESLLLMQQQVEGGQITPERSQAMLETGEPVQTGIEIVYEEQETLVVNQPSYEVCNNADVTIDPTCNGIIEDALFIVHEYDISWSELKADEYEVDEDGESSGFYHNIAMVKSKGSDIYDEFKSDESNNFEFQDTARKRMRAFEYWGFWDIQGDGELVSIVATWIDSTLVRLEENPFPHKRIPFSVATYMPVKKQVHGEPDAELLEENQDAIGRMTRAIYDITAQQAVGQEFIDENFFPSPSQKNAYEKGNTVYYRTGFDPTKSIYKQDIQQVGSTPFDVIGWQEKDASELSGTRPFSGSNGSRGLASDVEQKDVMDATAKRELSILRRLSDLLFTDMARMTIAMNQEFLEEEEIIRITGTEFVTIKRDDLEGSFDLTVEVSTPEKDNDQANKLNRLMQTNAADMDPELSKMHYIKMARLWHMDDLADEIENYEPEPDPIQFELQQLAVEEAKLKNAVLMKELEDLDSKIYERMSRTEKNSQADKEVALSKARDLDAKAEKTSAETDILNQQFLDQESGKSRLESIEDQEFKAANDKASDDRAANRELAGKRFDLISQPTKDSNNS